MIQQVFVAADDDGHFSIAHIFDRERVVRAIKSIDGGSYFDNICSENCMENIQDNYADLSWGEWFTFVHMFKERGRCEVLDVDLDPNYM